MKNNIEKPTPEAKALSLFLMAYKTINPTCKDESRRINKLWDAVKNDDYSKDDYIKEVKKVLTSHGGYSKVLAKTVQFYIDKTGEWKLKGDDKYCKDAQLIANKILNK